jgi:uncharacterized protein (TIGR03435 family)
MKRVLANVRLIVLLSGVSLGQTTDKPPEFEVADVHVSAPGASESGGFMPGRFELRGATLLDLISTAYGVEPAMILGGPTWLNSDKFDVIAKAPSASVSEGNLQAMLKALLADRFKLVARQDTKDMPVYVLTAGKAPKLRPPVNPGQSKTSRGEGEPNVNHLKCESFTMAQLAELLPEVARNYVDHQVVDKTGLEGAYDFQLDWMGIGPYRAAKANPDGPKPVSLFDGVEKLGLKLEAQKLPMPVIMVVSVNEKPPDNPPGVTTKIPTFPTEFDVAEVRPAKAAAAAEGTPGLVGQLGPMGRFEFQNGRVQILGATLKGLLSLAYDTTLDRITGGPKWLADDRFDVIAKTPANVPFDALKGMLKTLMAQRFALKTHTEDQPMPVYVLAAGKKPKLKESDGTARSECNIVNRDRRTYVCRNTTMAQFAERLPSVAAAYIHPPVLDLTSLKGAYDFDVYWTPKGQLSAGAKAGEAGQAPTPTDDLTVFEAVDKQLGLKLEEQKHPIQVLVVDHVDRTPSEK